MYCLQATELYTNDGLEQNNNLSVKLETQAVLLHIDLGSQPYGHQDIYAVRGVDIGWKPLEGLVQNYCNYLFFYNKLQQFCFEPLHFIFAYFLNMFFIKKVIA